MVAGEASGDLLASMLMDGIQSKWPETLFSGIGGPRMIQLGFQSQWPMQLLSVRGYVEVFRHYLEIISVRKKLCAQFIENPPDIFIGVDAPDFNLDLSRQLKLQGIPTAQFVCPSVWAWRANRIKKIRDSVDHVLCLFPFEPELLRKNGIKATYVGHPLAAHISEGVDRNQARIKLGLPTDALVLGILPGSRVSEIQHLLVRFLETAALLAKKNEQLIAVVPIAPGLDSLVMRLAQRFVHLPHLKLIQGQSHEVLAAADLALIASGTATLEAALFKCPMVIAYAMPWLSWQITKRQRLQAWVGLPNILSSELVVPEFLQDDAHPVALAGALQNLIDHPQQAEVMREKFDLLHRLLKQNTSRLATDAIAQIIKR